MRRVVYQVCGILAFIPRYDPVFVSDHDRNEKLEAVVLFSVEWQILDVQPTFAVTAEQRAGARLSCTFFANDHDQV